MHIQPGTKATTSYWLFPFVYLIVELVLIATKIKTKFTTLMSWHFFIMLFYLEMRLVAVKLKPGSSRYQILNNPYFVSNSARTMGN